MKRRTLIAISLALLMISVVSGVVYTQGTHDYDTNVPGSVSATQVDEGEVGDREVLKYENETVQEITSLKSILEAGGAVAPVQGQRDVELLRSLAKYEASPSDTKSVTGVFYVRHEGEVYRVAPEVLMCTRDWYLCWKNLPPIISILSLLGFVTMALYLLYTRMNSESG